MNKTRIIVGAAALLLVAAAVYAFTLPRPGGNAPEPAAVYAADADVNSTSDDTGKISVSGSGSVNVNPDVAYATLGVNTKAMDAKTALADNNKTIADVIAAIQSKGILEKDIRTTDFNMYPDYNYNYEKAADMIQGYNVSNNVSVVIRDISIVGDVLGAAAEAGANVSGGVQFALLDNSDVYNEALALAIKNASGKAQAIADAIGKQIGAPALVTETVSYYTIYEAGARNASRDQAEAQGVPVQTGKLTVKADVQLTYEYQKP